MPALKGKDIPPGPWVNPDRPRRMPLSSRLCRSCGSLMAQALVDLGEEYHWLCGPSKRFLKKS